MSNKKQSSVDWLFHKLWDEPKDKLTWYAILKQAKEMEKEQIVYAHLLGLIRSLDMPASEQAEQYYNETYGGNNEHI